jgi:hypothetical protein
VPTPIVRQPLKSLKLKNGYPTVYYQFLANVCHCGNQERIILFPQTSVIVARWFPLKGITAQLIYIDASHDFEDVYVDILQYYKCLDCNGILFGDDYESWIGVKKAVD